MSCRIVKNILKIYNLFRHVLVHAETIIREPKSVPSENYMYGSTVLVDMCIASSMAAYAHIKKYSGTIIVILARH